MISAGHDQSKAGHGADYDGVKERAGHGNETLTHGLLRLSGCSGDRCGTEAGLVGEDTACDALLHGDEDGAEHAAGSSVKAESGTEDDHERTGDLVKVGQQQDKGEAHVEHDHDGDDTLGDAGDALDAADDHQADQHGNHDTADDGGDGVIHAEDADREGLLGIEEVRDGGVNGVHLGESTDAEQAYAHAEEGEDLSEPAPADLGQTLAHAALDVVERAAQHVAGVLVDAAELDGKQTLGVLRCHAEQRCQPHPEHGTRAADHDSGCNAHDVASTDGC